jgi:hypothetical protein
MGTSWVRVVFCEQEVLTTSQHDYGVSASGHRPTDRPAGPLRDLQNQRIPHADFSRALETWAHHGDQQCAKHLIAVPLAGRDDDANGLVIRSSVRGRAMEHPGNKLLRNT